MSDERERILLIDDDPELLQLMGIVLHQEGYKVAVAKSGAEGLARAEAIQPHLIILDVMMPDMSGFEVCQRLRANSDLALTPILMLSAKGREEDKVRGLQAGADDYVEKPIGNKELLARVNTLMKRRRFAPAPPGRVIAFVGAKGGVGTTTVALNITAALAHQGKSVLLAEMRSHGGSIQHLLNLTTSQNLGPLLQENPTKMTGHDVSRQIIRNPPGIQLLLAPHSSDGYPLTGPHLEAMLRHLANKAEYILLDLTMASGDNLRPALETAEQILLVTEPEPLSMACAQAELEVLRQWAVYDRTSIIVVTRVSSAMSLSHEKIERQLGSRVMGIVSPAPEMFQEAARMGQLPVLTKPQTLASQSLVQIAERLTAER